MSAKCLLKYIFFKFFDCSVFFIGNRNKNVIQTREINMIKVSKHSNSNSESDSKIVDSSPHPSFVISSSLPLKLLETPHLRKDLTITSSGMHCHACAIHEHTSSSDGFFCHPLHPDLLYTIFKRFV